MFDRGASLTNRVQWFVQYFAQRNPAATKFAREFCEVQEWALALDTLLDNLYEARVELSDAELDEAGLLCESFGLSVDADILRGLRRDPNGRRRLVSIGCSPIAAVLRDHLAAELNVPSGSWERFEAGLQSTPMPHVFRLQGWDTTATRDPEGARRLLQCFERAQACNPKAAVLELHQGITLQRSFAPEGSA